MQPAPPQIRPDARPTASSPSHICPQAHSTDKTVHPPSTGCLHPQQYFKIARRALFYRFIFFHAGARGLPGISEQKHLPFSSFETDVPHQPARGPGYSLRYGFCTRCAGERPRGFSRKSTARRAPSLIFRPPAHLLPQQWPVPPEPPARAVPRAPAQLSPQAAEW